MQIRDLEKQLDVELIERRPGEAALTDIGVEVARRAEQLLRRAVKVSPGHSGFRAELAQTLIREKKLDEADAEVNAALESADSPIRLCRRRMHANG